MRYDLIDWSIDGCVEKNDQRCAGDLDGQFRSRRGLINDLYPLLIDDFPQSLASDSPQRVIPAKRAAKANDQSSLCC